MLNQMCFLLHSRINIGCSVEKSYMYIIFLIACHSSHFGKECSWKLFYNLKSHCWNIWFSKWQKIVFVLFLQNRWTWKLQFYILYKLIESCVPQFTFIQSRNVEICFDRNFFVYPSTFKCVWFSVRPLVYLKKNKIVFLAVLKMGKLICLKYDNIFI